jgi:hypothetical protein
MALLKNIFIFYITTAITILLVNSLSVQNDKCSDGQAPLADYFCGRGINRRDCPSTHHCVIAPNDAYAVCCPVHQQRDVAMIAHATDNKPGSCPPPSGMIGICIARCSTDNDCAGDQKCCGSCPRQCSSAVF